MRRIVVQFSLKGDMLNSIMRGNLAQAQQYPRPISEIRDANMRRKRDLLGCNRPNMEIVDFLDPLDANQLTPQFLQVDMFGHPVQRAMQGFLQQAYA